MSTNAIKIYVGVTDLDWFEFLSRRQDVDEVNFWQPGGAVAVPSASTGRAVSLQAS